MNAAQKGDLFWMLFGGLDSDQPGEREAALGKIHSLREKMGWPRFVDLRGVTPEQLKEAEQNREKWEQAHAARVAENAALARRNAALAARIAILRSSLLVMLNWRMMAVAASWWRPVSAAGACGTRKPRPTRLRSDRRRRIAQTPPSMPRSPMG